MTERMALDRHKIFALLLLGGAMIVAVLPLVALHRAYDASISDLADLLVRYQRTAALHGALQAQLAESREGASATRRYLTGESPTLAGASLVDLATGVIESAGGQIVSTQILPAVSDGKFQKIAVKIRMIASIGALKEIFGTLETGSPFLFVDAVDLRQTGRARRARRSQQPATPERALIVEFGLYGYIQPTAAVEES